MLRVQKNHHIGALYLGLPCIFMRLYHVIRCSIIFDRTKNKTQEQTAKIFPIFSCGFFLSLFCITSNAKFKEISVAFACVFVMTSFCCFSNSMVFFRVFRFHTKSDVSAVCVIFMSMCDSFGIIFPPYSILPFHASTRLYRFECKSSLSHYVRAV